MLNGHGEPHGPSFLRATIERVKVHIALRGLFGIRKLFRTLRHPTRTLPRDVPLHYKHHSILSSRPCSILEYTRRQARCPHPSLPNTNKSKVYPGGAHEPESVRSHSRYTWCLSILAHACSKLHLLPSGMYPSWRLQGIVSRQLHRR